MDINSISYWDDRFKNNSWSKCNGENQTTYFMKLLISALSIDIYNDIFYNCKTILDYGCALGQGCCELSKTFSNADIIGYDFSKIAIENSKTFYNNINFINSLNKNDKYDVIFCSNVLEHSCIPLYYIMSCLKIINKYYIILVPYKEDSNNLIVEHFSCFNEDYFPNEINHCHKVQSTIITDIQKEFWGGNQLLVVYKKQP